VFALWPLCRHRHSSSSTYLADILYYTTVRNARTVCRHIKYIVCAVLIVDDRHSIHRSTRVLFASTKFVDSSSCRILTAQVLFVAVEFIATVTSHLLHHFGPPHSWIAVNPVVRVLQVCRSPFKPSRTRNVLLLCKLIFKINLFHVKVRY